MLNEILLLNKNHNTAAHRIFERVMSEYKSKYIITISGEVETGKAEVAHMLGMLFKKEGIVPKLIHMDSYYKISPAERTQWRKEHGIESIGFEEYDWDMVNKNITAFLKGTQTTMPCVDLFTGQIDQLTTSFEKIDVLIIEGLYSIKIENASLKVFIEMTYKETMNEQKASGKEKLDDFRMKVLEQEHKVVQSLKSKADFYLDFDTGREIFHL